MAPELADAEPEVFECVCEWCGERTELQFDLRESFVCADVGKECSAESRHAVAQEPDGEPEGELDCSSWETDSEEDDGDEGKLFPASCEWCGAKRWLPFDLSGDFVCSDVGLACAEREEAMVENCCRFCGEWRELPFDLGEAFACSDAGFECPERAEGQDEFGLFEHFCLDCGAQRWLPFDVRQGFVCGDAPPLVCLSEELRERHANVCDVCGKTQMCAFGMSEGFVCGACGGGARPRVQEALPPRGADESDDDDPELRARRTAMRRENERTQLLWRVMLYHMSIAAARPLFLEKGFQPPNEQELLDLRSGTLDASRRKTIGRRAMARAALKSKNKKGSQQRWLNNEKVTVQKKEKYLRIGGESAEDKARTSVELYIVGIGRGGRHAVKLAREEKKKGPVSKEKKKVPVSKKQRAAGHGEAKAQ